MPAPQALVECSNSGATASAPHCQTNCAWPPSCKPPPERSLPNKPNFRHPKTYLAVLSGTVSWPRTSSRVIVRSTSSKLSKSEESGGNPSAGKDPQQAIREPTTSECAGHGPESPFIDKCSSPGRQLAGGCAPIGQHRLSDANEAAGLRLVPEGHVGRGAGDDTASNLPLLSGCYQADWSLQISSRLSFF